MKNEDNKTIKLFDFNLLNYKNLLEKNPLHIATISDNCLPNLAVASDVKVLDKSLILISCNEMIHTPDNIKKNNNIVVTCFNTEWSGLRMTGFAKFFKSGKYFDLVNEYFKNETTTPKGAIVVNIEIVEEIE